MTSKRLAQNPVHLFVALVAALLGALLLAVPQTAPAQADAAGAGGNFVPLTTNVRVLDTRNAVGVTTKTPLGAGAQSAAFAVTGVGGIPTTGVTGVLATVSALGATADTSVTVFPDGASPAASTVHVASGNPNLSNSLTTPLSAAGKLKAYNGYGTTHVVVDIQGYFTSSNTTGGGFVPGTPTRVVDSRSDIGTTGGAIAPGATRTITLPAALVPATAAAVYLNLNVLQATRAGTMSLSPAGADGSSFNYAVGNSSSGISAKLSAGKFVVKNSSSAAAAHVIIDVEGYWTSSPTTGAGFRATPSTGMLLDTGAFATEMPPGATYTFAAAGALGLPTQGVAGVLVNIHVRKSGAGTSFHQAWASGTTKPATSVNNNPGSDTRDSLHIVKPGADGRISIQNSSSSTGSTDVWIQIEGWFADPLPALAITPAARIAALQRAGAAGAVRPIDFAFTNAAGWLQVGRIVDPNTLSVDETNFQLLSGGSAFTQSPALAEGADGKLTVVGHNADSNVWTKTETTASSTAYPAAWTQRGGSPTGPPTIARLSDGRLAMVAVDANGALWTSLQPTAGGAFDAWRQLGNPGLNGAVSVVPNSSGGASLFARTTAGSIVTSTYTVAAADLTGQWNDRPAASVGAWTDLGNPGAALDTTGAPAVGANGAQRRLVVRRPDSTIWTRLYTGTTWGAWSQIPGQAAAAGEPAVVLHPVNTTWQVLVRTSAGNLAWASEVLTGSGTWTSWKNTYAGVANDPAGLTWTQADNSRGWGVLFSDTANHQLIGNFTDTVPPSPAAAKGAAPRFTRLTPRG